MSEADNIQEDDDLEKPMEIELEDEGGEEGKPAGSVADTVPGAIVAPGKKRPRYKETVVRLKGENRQISEAAQRLFDENQRLKSDMANLSQSGMVNYERGLASEQKLAQITLTEAIKSEDAEAQAAAQTEVARIASEMNDVKAWKAQNPAPAAQDPAARQQQKTLQPNRLAEPVKQWIDQNSWFDERTEEYNEDMHLEAVEYAKVLEARMIRQGKAAEINTPSYFAKIQEHMVQEYPAEFGAEDEEEDVVTPPARQQQRVAPAVRTAPAVAAKGKTAVSLTSEDVSQVRRMVAENAVKHPWDHPDVTKRGQTKTFDEAIRDFAIRKRASDANPSERQPNRR